MAYGGDAQVVAWREYNETPWGRLRLDLIWAQLEGHVVPFPPHYVFDIGCGLGETGIRLASSGSNVVGVDASPEMVAAAQTAAEAARVEAEWAVLNVDAIEGASFGRRFDLILAHNLLGYVRDPAGRLVAIAQLLAIDGQLSIVVGNRLAEPLRYALMRHDLRGALQAVETPGRTRLDETFGIEIGLTDIDEVSMWLERAGLRVETSIGVRCVNDYLVGADELKSSAEGYGDLLRLELAMGERNPYRQIAPLLHVARTAQR